MLSSGCLQEFSITLAGPPSKSSWAFADQEEIQVEKTDDQDTRVRSSNQKGEILTFSEASAQVSTVNTRSV